MKTIPIGIFPQWLAIAVTWKCNAKCSICNIWQSSDNTYINVDDLLESLGDVFFDGIKSINIFGGEPTEHNKLPEIVSGLRCRFPNASLSIITNGIDETRIYDIFKVIHTKITRELSICVSIYGTPDIHDRIKGVQGAYNNAIKVIEYAIKFFIPRHRISLTISPNFTCEIEHVSYLCKKFNTDMSLRTEISGSYFHNKNQVNWTLDKILKLTDKLSKIPDSMLAHPNFVRNIPEFLRLQKHYICQAPRLSLVVNPDLSTSVCHIQPPLGLLKDIPKIWGRCPNWYQLGALDCFTKECYHDGPYSLSFIKGI